MQIFVQTTHLYFRTAQDSDVDSIAVEYNFLVLFLYDALQHEIYENFQILRKNNPLYGKWSIVGDIAITCMLEP